MFKDHDYQFPNIWVGEVISFVLTGKAVTSISFYDLLKQRASPGVTVVRYPRNAVYKRIENKFKTRTAFLLQPRLTDSFNRIGLTSLPLLCSMSSNLVKDPISG